MPEKFSFAGLRLVNTAGLEKELSGLWRTAAEDTHHPVVRACTLTLLVYVESEEAGGEVRELIPGLMRDHPCRAITLIVQEAGSPGGLSAEVSAQCFLPVAGEKAVCCEQISIVARGEAVENLDRIVLPVIVPGLPVYFWWRAGRFAPPRHLHRLLRAADHIGVDSARFPDSERDLAGFLTEIKKLPANTVVTDLNWSRLTRWRELIAQCFDSAQTRSWLDQITEVRIEFEKDSPRVLAHRAQSLLLIAWLASRLGWEPVEVGGPGPEARSFLFRCGERAIQVARIPRHFEGGGEGACVSITLRAGGPFPAEFHLSRGCDGRTVRTRNEISGRPPVERAVLLPVLDEVALVNEEIKFALRDQVYEDALAMLGRMTGQ